MKYLIHYEATGEGCDYTIGCNHAIGFTDAASMEDAIEKLTESLLSEDSWYTPEDLAKVTIYEIGERHLLDIYGINVLRKERERKQHIKAEFALYEVLKARYGNEK